MYTDSLTVGGIVEAVGGKGNAVYLHGGETSIGGGLFASGGSNIFQSLAYYDNEVNLTVNGNVISESGGSNGFNVGSPNSSITITGDMITTGGSNAINTSDAPGSGPISIHGRVDSIGGKTTMHLRYADNSQGELEILGGVYASDKGANTIQIYSENSSVTTGSFVASDGGSNQMILFGSGDVTIEGSIVASERGVNLIRSNGGGTVIIREGMESHEDGWNQLSMGGESEIYLYGNYTGWNEIFTSAENDYVYLDGHVGEYGLFLHADAGYDTLTLKAESALDMADRYQDWLESYSGSSTDLNSFGVESIKLDLTGSHNNLESLVWLGDIVSDHNSGTGNFMQLELKVDTFGRTMSLGDFFSSGTDDIFTALDLGGTNANTLQVDGAFADNDIDEYSFAVHGDSSDTVQLSNDWFFIGDSASAEGPDYSYYTTGLDLLMIQSEIHVIMGA